ncbi:MAG TPA: metallophosphoesterase [Thermoanaerobaculia bacterium]|jgi:orotate phosphoribosyltransferase|nr:metallophosphoesterase [Thermoanaerobaculia bacterium]
MKRCVLHVTDFHIRDPRDPSEHLRERYYDEYLSELREVFRRAGFDGAIDALFATGDFVDCGLTDNFQHAQQVLQFLADSWEVGLDRVVTCIGNHDVDRDKERLGQNEEARKHYYEFSRRFLNASGTATKMYSGISGRIDDSFSFLALDSTLNGVDRPGRLEGTEIDDILEWVKQHTRSGDFLVICSHFPVDLLAGSLGPFEDSGSDWYLRHVWGGAATLRERLLKNAKGPTLWLAGDIHREAVLQDGRVAFCTTGRLGVSARKPYGEVRRQASIIELNDEAEFRIWRAEFRSEGNQDAHTGQWEAQEISWHRLERPSGVRVSISPPSPPIDQRAEAPVAQAQAAKPVELIDPDYETELVRLIAEDGLYKFGRFETVTQGEVSLSWVNVDSICALGGQLEPIVKRMGRWLVAKTVLEKIAAQDLVLLGMDCWGTIFASQLSAMLGSRFFPVATRAEGKFNRAGDGLDEEACKLVEHSRVVVLVTDVVGTGKSLKWVVETIAGVVGKELPVKWFALSMICDVEQNRGATLDFLAAHGSLCTSLRMPLCDSNALPSRDVFPPNLSFF